ncbi:MAG: hypothetical protein FJW39_07520 [Acidobacteria bacterium]|nr:hypothetical protein [Acidobacteriota bacterium]
MPESFREFEAADPFGKTLQVKFVWLQTAISIRHADAVDVKFTLLDGAYRDEKVIALPHPVLRAMAGTSGRPLSDAWVSKLAASHLRRMIETGEDMEKPLVTMSTADIEAADSRLREAAAA